MVERTSIMEFLNTFRKIGIVRENHDCYRALKAEYMAKGYSAKKARYAALGCMSGRTQGPTAKWYRQDGKVYFERLA